MILQAEAGTGSHLEGSKHWVYRKPLFGALACTIDSEGLGAPTFICSPAVSFFERGPHFARAPQSARMSAVVATAALSAVSNATTGGAHPRSSCLWCCLPLCCS